MGYLDETLIFESDRIYYTDEAFGGEMQVMMSWEDPIMKASADYVCEGGGDILEIGFGMGISAGHIQANSITSHTIVENHPQVIEKAKAGAADKPNVTIVEGGWYEIKNSLSTYDGIFYDTWGEDDWTLFATSIASLCKSGAKVTWWNTNTSANTIHNIDSVSYEPISVNPKSNMYFNSTTYYLPKKVF